MITKKNSLNNIVEVNGSKVYTENGEVKSLLNEVIQSNGYMSVEEAMQLTIEKIKMIYQQNNAL